MWLLLFLLFTEVQNEGFGLNVETISGTSTCDVTAHSVATRTHQACVQDTGGAQWHSC